MKNIWILMATFFLSSCICLLACKDFNYEVGDDLKVTNLNSFWKVNPISNSRIAVIYKWFSIYIDGLPSNLVKQGCKDTPNGTWFEFNFQQSSAMSLRKAPNILFNNNKVFVIEKGKKIHLKPAKRYYKSDIPGTYSLYKDQPGYEHISGFAFKIPCEVVITPDTIIHIGGIIENGKELPPIEFKVYKKGTYDTESAS